MFDALTMVGRTTTARMKRAAPASAWCACRTERSCTIESSWGAGFDGIGMTGSSGPIEECQRD
jgi:hypothetical protein